MATLASIISADLGSAANDFYITFTWGSNTIKGYISTVETNKELDVGCFRHEYRANLFVQDRQVDSDGVTDPTTV